MKKDYFKITGTVKAKWKNQELGICNFEHYAYTNNKSSAQRIIRREVKKDIIRAFTKNKPRITVDFLDMQIHHIKILK